MGAAGWAVVACICPGLRVLGAVLVGAGRVPAWSGPLVEVLLWIGGPAIVDPAALSNAGFWLGLLALLLLWAPVVDLARRPHAPRSPRVVLVVAGVFAVAVQAASTQLLLAGTISEATAGQVCQTPRRTIDVDGDLFPAPPGTTLTVCVQGRPGGGYIGD